MTQLYGWSGGDLIAFAIPYISFCLWTAYWFFKQGTSGLWSKGWSPMNYDILCDRWLFTHKHLSSICYPFPVSSNNEHSKSAVFLKSLFWHSRKVSIHVVFLTQFLTIFLYLLMCFCLLYLPHSSFNVGDL